MSEEKSAHSEPGPEARLGSRVDLASVRGFWEREPVAAREVPFPPGTESFFEAYDQRREENESPAFSAALHEFEASTARRVLDVGCGNGYVLERYARSGRSQAVGVDLTRRAVELTTARLALARVRAGVLQADAERLPFATASFDCICSMGVLHHSPSPERAVAEIHRVLRPGGRLLLMMYHRDSFLFRIWLPFARTFLRRHRGKSIQTLVNQVDGEGNPLGRVYSRAQLARLLRGFVALEFSVGQLKPSDLPRLGRFLPDALYRWAERRWGWFLYVKARRGP
ncbi:MAG: class I SAM-dependent methyltransferase [Planctomycetes bacterium]|nr:class I SAM-dependent methyltransferase [Planctomycetota bacterium]